MASITPLRDKWRAQIHIKGVRDSKVFPTESAARDWAAARESKLRERAAEMVKRNSGALKFSRGSLKEVLEVPLTHAEIIEGATPVATLSGVYFLIRDKRVVYVGQSTNVFRRLTEHLRDGRRFDSFTISLCAKKDLERMETKYMRALFPEENIIFGKVMNKQKSREKFHRAVKTGQTGVATPASPDPQPITGDRS